MGLIASLDMGSDQMVMALAGTGENGSCRLNGIKYMVSQGIQQGQITDKSKVQLCIRSLANELLKDKPIGCLNIALSGMVRMEERKVSVNLPRKVVEQGCLDMAGVRCAEGIESRDEELIDMIPVAYSVDRGDLIANPLGKHGRTLEVYYQVYVADYNELSELRSFFSGYEIDEINFYPLARVYSEALDAENTESDFALVDLGAMNIRVVLFREGLMEYEAVLPLGVQTIDYDMMSAFGIDNVKARKLKHEYGQALRAACKNRKLVIPDTKLTIDSRDLATVVQCRMEELLEGAVYLLQQWGFNRREDEIILTGGGSRLSEVDILLGKLSGHRVVRARVKRIQTLKEEILKTPEYMVALGLLLCMREEPEAPKTGLFEKLKGLFS